MGIQDRDYVRDERRGGGAGFASEYPAVRTIIFITVLVYLLQIFVTRPPNNEEIRQLYPQFNESTQLEDLPVQEQIRNSVLRAFPKVSVVQQWLQMDTQKVLQGQVWRLLTSAFCHDRSAIFHILINMLLLFWFGREMETIYGTRSFAWFYVTAAVLSAAVFMLVQLATGERIPAIGASGAVMAVMMIYTMYHPRDTILLFFVIPIQIRFLLFFYVIYDLHPVLRKLAGEPVPTGIAHAAHLGGLAYGYFFYRTGISFLSLWDRTPMARAQDQRRKRKGTEEGEPRILSLRGPYGKDPQRPPDDKLDRQVDDILAKISQSGRESLTEEEVSVLEKASRKYNERTDR